MKRPTALLGAGVVLLALLAYGIEIGAALFIVWLRK